MWPYDGHTPFFNAITWGCVTTFLCFVVCSCSTREFPEGVVHPMATIGLFGPLLGLGKEARGSSRHSHLQSPWWYAGPPNPTPKKIINYGGQLRVSAADLRLNHVFVADRDFRSCLPMPFRRILLECYLLLYRIEPVGIPDQPIICGLTAKMY